MQATAGWRRARMAAAFLLAAGLIALAPPQRADAALPPGFRDFTVLSGLDQPTTVEFAADGRVFVAEKSGIVKVFDSLDDTTATIFADLRTNVFNYWDRGLLGLALHPDFPVDPSVYVLYTHDADIGGTAPKYGTAGATGDSCTVSECVVSGRLSRLTAGAETMTGEEQVLVEDWCQQFPSHSIGALAFGADGALYASAGDGASFNQVDYGQLGSPANPCGDPPGSAGTALSAPAAEGGALRSQDLRTTGDAQGLDGTVIRIDPTTGEGLADNPLADSSDANARRIIATGLRNPFRITFRPGTDELYIGEVGWNSWEEVNRIADVNDAQIDNFGWPCYEGPSKQGGYDGANVAVCENLYESVTATPGTITPPLFAWSHGSEVLSGDGCGTGSSSASGVAFAGDDAGYPEQYEGALFFTDYSRQCIWAIPTDESGALDPAARTTFLTDAEGPVDLTAGPGGDLYYVAVFDGTLRRIGYSAGNQTPFADLAASATSGEPPLEVTFSATGSSDPDPGDSLSYAWDLDGDGAFDDSSDDEVTRTYDVAGPVTVRLRVTDSFGATDEASTVVSVGTTAPVPEIATPAESSTAAVGDVVSFAGSATDPQEGELPASALTWSALLRHCSAPETCHTHPAFLTAESATSGSFAMPDHERIAYVELTLSATSGGETRSVTRRIDYTTTELTFASDPAGIPLTVNSATETAPFTRTAHTNGGISVSAPATATVDGVEYAFVGWSDGGAQAHDVTVPETPTTYTATYAAQTIPPGTSLLTDTFEDGDSEGWTAATGSWSVCQPPGNSQEYCADSTADSASLAGSSEWTDYSVESAVRMATLSGGAAVLGRVQDATHYYQLELKRDPSSGEERWWIWERDGSSWLPVASGPYDYAADTYYHLRLTMDGPTLTAAISDDGGAGFTDLGSGSDTSYTAGRIGLRSWGTRTTFDVVKVIAQ